MTSSETTESPFRGAAENGLDLLLRAATLLNGDPKVSIVAFAAGLEILLKARLLKEHWSLVVDDIDRVDFDSFRNGTFRSITPEQALRRLRSVCAERIRPDDEKALLAPSRHRNRVLHFYHPDLASGATTEQREAIAVEQCRAWTLLHDLLTSASWKDHLIELMPTVQKVHEAFRSVGTVFLHGRFEAIRATLAIEQANGLRLIACPTCHFEAQALDSDESPLFLAHCRVCGSLDAVLLVACQACSHEVLFINRGDQSCSSCSAQLSAQAFLPNVVSPPSSWEECPEVACRQCETSGTVVQRAHDDPFCLSCFEFLQGFEHCERCSQDWAVGYSGSLEEIGCPFCGFGGEDYHSHEPWS